MGKPIDIFKPPSDNLWIEPESPATKDNPPQYPYNKVMKSDVGSSLELDDTPNRERVRLQHGKSGNFLEMHPNGDEVHKIWGDGFEIVSRNKNVLIKGSCNITVNGNCSLEVLGDFSQRVDGDYNLAVKGQMNIRAVKDIWLSGDQDVSISANEKFGGSLRLSSSQSLNLGSDLYIRGSITCDTLTAESRVSAGMGVFAGPYGFTSGLGGLSLGFPTPTSPAAVPGCINTVGYITSLTSVNAPIANFSLANVGVLDSVLMMDLLNSLIFDMHIHPSPHGATGTPAVKFIGV